MMSKLDKEERVKLRNLYRQERLSKLENLKNIAETTHLDDSKIDEETIRYLAHDDLNEDDKHQLLRESADGISPMQKRALSEAQYYERALKE